jgi:DNA-binding response OmpR family regulator
VYPEKAASSRVSARRLTLNSRANISLVPNKGTAAGSDSHLLRPVSLLVIDDDSVHRMVIGKVGEKAGYVLTTANSIDDAAKKLQERKFDCISLDLSLGGESGAQVLGVIAQTNSQALLIVISGAAPEVRKETLERAQSLSINVAEAPKPVDLIALRARLNAHLQSAKA